MRFLLLLTLLCLAAPSPAVVIDSGDGSGNTTMPVPDPGWDYVAARGGSLTAVYLGDGWVLTANHVPTGAVELGGVSYDPIPGTDWRLRNADGSKADLKLFALQTYPSWPLLPIASITPSLGTDVVMIGQGLDRGAATSWDPNGPPPPGPIGGYLLENTRTLRWGTNQIEDIPVDPIEDTWAIGTIFDAIGSGGTPHEAQAANGDSGGALFVENGGSWELAGLLYVIFIYNGQPANAVLYGSATYAADLAMYRDEIKDVTGLPEPVGALPIGALLVGALARRRAR